MKGTPQSTEGIPANGNLLARRLDALLHQEPYMDRAQLLSLEEDGLVLGQGDFAVAVFFFAGVQSPLPPVRAVEQQYDVLRDIVQRTLERSHICYTGTINGWTVSLICCLSTEEGERAYQRELLRRSCQKAVDAASAQLGHPVHTLVNTVHRPGSLARSYSAIADEYNFRRFFDRFDESVLFLDDTWGDGIRYQCWERVVHDAKEFCDLVLQNQRDKGLRIVENLLTFFCSFRPLSLSRVFWDLQSFFDTVLYRFAMGSVFPEDVLSRIEISRRVFESDNSQTLLHVLRSIAGEFFDTHTRYRGRTAALRIQSVQAYIEDNLADCTLSATSVAEHFGISQPLLSSQFKKYCGRAFWEYVQDLRIERAKTLLEETGLSMEDIAAVTGFGSAATFHRNFKKHTGISPGQYRKARKVFS